MRPLALAVLLALGLAPTASVPPAQAQGPQQLIDQQAQQWRQSQEILAEQARQAQQARQLADQARQIEQLRQQMQQDRQQPTQSWPAPAPRAPVCMFCSKDSNE